MSEFLTHLEKIKKYSFKIIIFDIIGFIWSIIFLILSIVMVEQTTYSPTYGQTTYPIGLVVFWIISLTVILGLGITIIAFSIMIVIKATHAKALSLSKDFDEIGTIKILAIIGIFFAGTIFAIINFIMTKNMIQKIKKEGTQSLETNNSNNWDNNHNNNQQYNEQPKNSSINQNMEKIRELWELKEKGVISNEEFSKLKEELFK